MLSQLIREVFENITIRCLHKNPFGKLSTNVLRRNLYFSRHDHVFQVQTATNCPSPIKLELQSESTRSSRSFLIFLTLCSLSLTQSDLYGQSLLNITHPEDHAFLKQQLIPTDLHNLFLAKTDENGEVRQRTQEEEEEIDRKLREDRRDFNIR